MSIETPKSLKDLIIYILSLGVLGYVAPAAIGFGRSIRLTDNVLVADGLSYVFAGLAALACWQLSVILMKTITEYVLNRNKTSSPPLEEYNFNKKK